MEKEKRTRCALRIAALVRHELMTDLMDEEECNKSCLSRHDVLLKDWMQAYAKKKAQHGQSDSHAHNIRNTLLHLIKYKGEGVLMAEVDKTFCQGFIAYLANGRTIGCAMPLNRGEHHEKPLAVSTARLYFNSFASALNEAVREGILSSNPVYLLKKEDKKPIFKNNTSRAYLNIDEIKALVDTPCKDAAVKSAFLFACFCGLRISDVRSLRWSDIQQGMDGAYIYKKMQKTQLMVMVPLSANALAWMPDRGVAQPNDLVFRLPSYASINHKVKQWAATAHIEKPITFHASRHTFATSLLSMGADLYTTSKLLGHQNICTTQIYAEIVNKKKVEAVRLLDRICAKQ